MLDPERIKAAVSIVDVINSYTPLKKLGKEYVGKCPLHGGDGDNFNVVPAKGIWMCWSRGCHECDEGNDVIGFIRLMEHCSFNEACERLNGGSSWPQAAPIAQKAAPRPERVTSKPPADAGVPNMAIRALGEPSRIWPYRDTDGGVLGYVARYETKDEKGEPDKEIRCWTWGSRDGVAPAWACGHWTKPRPLYALDRLGKHPDRPVLVVEGEKAADAAAKILPQYVATTWPGGAQAWKHADLTPLKGRRVDLWPDADEPGREAMARLAAILADPRGLACHGKIIDTAGEPEGADAADWQGTDVIGWLRARAKEYGPASATAAPDEPPPLDPADLPPAPEDAAEPAKARKPRRKPALALVDGNTALAPDSEPLPAAMSEDAIADAFAAQHENDWRYVKQWDSWLHWDGDGWQRDRKELIDRLAVEMCRRAGTWPEAASLTPEGRRRLGQRKTAGAVRDLARHDRRIAASPEGWDADPLLVGIPGGVFDVRAGKVILGEREQYITLRTAVAPAAGKPARWLDHMRRMMDGDDTMINFLHTYAGYCATGDTREQCFIFLYGQGQTGKGTFLLTLAELLGGYAAMSAASTFMHSNQDKHSSEIARLSGCRLVVIDETDGSTRWNEERLKRMTGGGKITAARKYHDEEDIQVTWKLAFAGNHKPALRGVGKEMERRIRLVKCNASIPDEDVDRNFRARMIAEEGPQILNWILEGAVAWHDGGLPLPEAVSDATRDYLTSEDVIGDWITERCDDGGECDRPTAYRNYSAWMEKRGDRAWSNRAWWSALEDRGYRARKSDGQWRIVGLELKMLASDEPPAARYPD